MIGPVKQFVGQSVFAAGLHSALLRNAAVVVAFHHIEGGAANSLSVDPTTFERYCRFFRQHFRVVSLSDLVARIANGEPLKRQLAITFDDGYMDNFDNAAPILEQLGLTATFFVVTKWIGSAVVPWWERDRQVRPEWMTWDHVRSLHRRGFDIGGHTQTHVDLGAVTGEVARREIVGSRLDLEDQLGAPVRAFAYPYGGRHNVTEANRQLVRAAGYDCCCSCFGGNNGVATDPFEIRRVPITPYSTPHQFGFDIALGLNQFTI